MYSVRMTSLKPIRFIGSIFSPAIPFAAILGVVLAAGFTARAFAQDASDVGPQRPVVVKPMESHIGNVTGHAAAAKADYPRYCAGCLRDPAASTGHTAHTLPPTPPASPS